MTSAGLSSQPLPDEPMCSSFILAQFPTADATAKAISEGLCVQQSTKNCLVNLLRHFKRLQKYAYIVHVNDLLLEKAK